MGSVLAGGVRVGVVLSAAYGHRVEAAIALAMLDASGPAGAVVQVAVYGRMHEATVQPGTCLWDADDTRLRASAERSLAHGTPA